MSRGDILDPAIDAYAKGDTECPCSSGKTIDRFHMADCEGSKVHGSHGGFDASLRQPWGPGIAGHSSLIFIFLWELASVDSCLTL